MHHMHFFNQPGEGVARSGQAVHFVYDRTEASGTLAGFHVHDEALWVTHRGVSESTFIYIYIRAPGIQWFQRFDGTDQNQCPS